MKRFSFSLEHASLAALAVIGLVSGLLLSGVSYARGQTVEGISLLPTDAWAPYEKQLFLQSFENEPLPERLARLETRVFGEVHANGSIQQRGVSLITALEKSGIGNSASLQASNSTPPRVMMARKTKDAKRESATDYPTVTALERHDLKATFEKDDITERLNRLEVQMFGEASSTMPLADRVDRLLRHRPVLSNESKGLPVVASQGEASPGFAPVVPPMVQIGAGYSDNTRWGFSDELLQMLPPGMRSQITAGKAPASTPPRVEPTMEHHAPTSGAPFAVPSVLGVPLAP